jgi:putative FmdB family regulatory protein
MPIYEYQCAQCGKQIEVLQKVSDKPLSKCASCNGRLYRLLSPSAFQFKGSGWYVTDYARKGSDGKAKKDKSAPPEGTAKESAAPAPPKSSDS